MSKDQSELPFTDIRTELEGLAKIAEGYKAPPKKESAFIDDIHESLLGLWMFKRKIVSRVWTLCQDIYVRIFDR